MNASYFTSESINEHVIRIVNPSAVYSYLVIGEKRAVLIDTGCGLGNLKEYVDHLTDKPYTVLLTHGHVDHAGGASLFPEVYLNEADWKLAAEHTQLAVRVGYLSSHVKAEEADLAAPKEEGYLPLDDKDRFDLGGLHVAACAFPGHTPGSMAFLIEEDGIMLLGDACNSCTFLQMDMAPALSVYADTAERFRQEHLAQIRALLFSHSHNRGTPEILQEAVDTCREIAGGVAGIPIPVRGSMVDGCLLGKPVDERMNRLDGKTFNMVYRPENAR